MQEIITEILERLGFPTKNVEELVTSIRKNWELHDLVSLTVITSDTEIRAYYIDNRVNSLGDIVAPFCDKWHYCSLGSELVARLKGGE